MARYLIHESNFERLEKKLATIQKKCQKSHCEFKYEVVDTKYQNCKAEDGTEYTAKYFEIEVEGKAQYNGWRFVATLDHHTEGNVIRAFDTELTIPDKYKTCGPTCEHCNKIRSRKDTYIVYNDEKNEFKQVGKSCLQEFTDGLSAEDVAFFCSIYEAAENSYGYTGMSFTQYIAVESILNYAFECYKHWGYQKTQKDEDDFDPTYRSTKERVTDYYYINRESYQRRDILKAEMDEVGFNPESEYAVESTKAALEWIRNIPESEINSEYIRNLHIICSDEYTDWRSLGILVSLTVAYARHTEQIAAYEKKQKAISAEKAASNWVGEVGSKLEIEIDTFECKSSWYNTYGVTYLYKFTDKSGNVFIWYASNPVNDEETVSSIKGTVKEHSEFNGIKQTVLTRCKASYAPKVASDPVPGHPEKVEDAISDFLNFVNS